MTPAMLQIMCELESLITERCGMVAENMLRESLGQSMAYDENAFAGIARGIMGLVERSRSL